MDYFKILNLNKEPFSNSPDPNFFYMSKQYVECLQRLEISLRLRRGLNVIIGDLGTGKTTLGRLLIQKLVKDKKKLETHLLLDPGFSTSYEFLSTIAEMFDSSESSHDMSEWQLKEKIKKYLFKRGIDEEKTVILIIDEGQKIADFGLEILREFLNYETNEYKLLQVVIFAQKEFEATIQKRKNLADRINLYYYFGPLNYSETRSMIQYRLNKASENRAPRNLFTYPALFAIYLATGGYPRKIVHLCNRVILTIIIQNQAKARWPVVRASAVRVFPAQKRKWQMGRAAIMSIATFIVLWGLGVGGFGRVGPWIRKTINQVASKTEKVTFSKTSPTAVIQSPPVTSVKNSSTAKATKKRKPATNNIHTEYPKILGKLKLKRGETLGEMIQNVYGAYNNHNLKMVAKANPHLKSTNSIHIGETINFPSIPVKPLTQTKKSWSVQIAKTQSLNLAYNKLKEYPQNAPAITIIPCWNRKEGLCFLILLKQYFQNKLSASRTLAKIPHEFVSNSKIFVDWDNNTTYFSGFINES